MLKKLEGLSSELVSENPYWQYRRDLYRLPSGTLAPYYYASTRGSVFIIARTEDHRFVMMNQFRYLNQRESLEFPGGGIAKEMQPQQQAKAELQEEAGLEAGTWMELGVFNPMNGLTNELCHVYLAEDLREIQARPEESEEFERCMLTPDELESGIASNKIWDGMTLAAWALYKALQR